MERTSFRDRYFRDYSRKIVMDRDTGATHVEFVYEGVYYTAAMTAKNWRRRKVLLAAAVVLSAFLLLSAMTVDVPANRGTDVVLMETAVLFLLLGDGVGAVSRLMAKPRMTRQEYRMGVKTLTECSGLAAVVLVMLLLDLGVSFGLGRWPWQGELVGLRIRLVLLVSLCTGLYYAVKGERYTAEQSHDLPHGIDITDDFVNF